MPLVAAVALAAALVLAPAAGASRYLRVGLFDDGQVLYGSTDAVFKAMQELNSQIVRVNLWWGGPALTVARRKPANPMNPDDPAYNWDTYDRTVRYAVASGMQPIFSVVGTPGWANDGRGWNVAPVDPIDLKRFVTAAARRYSGTWPGADGKPLPRVSLWLAWNEPNNPVFLKPQWTHLDGRWAITSGRAYARICNAVVDGAKTANPTNKVGCGVTGPRGNNNPNSARSSVAPLAFLRAMKAAGARGFDAYAHHPYYGTPQETPSTPPPPGVRGQPPTAITLGNIDVLVRELTRLYGNRRLWITEYGYQTNPPDRIFGVTTAKQAQYLREAYEIVQRHPRIDMFLWFLLRDEIRPDGWQSGLLTVTGKRKPAYEVFQQLRT